MRATSSSTTTRPARCSAPPASTCPRRRSPRSTRAPRAGRPASTSPPSPAVPKAPTVRSDPREPAHRWARRRLHPDRDPQPPHDDDLSFLLDAAALERLSGPLCDDVMERDRLRPSPGRACALQPVPHPARRPAGVVPLPPPAPRSPIAELRLRSETRARRCTTRAAAWHGSRADDETALEYAFLAGDIDLAAQLLPELAQRAYNSGRVGSLRRWFEALDEAACRVPLRSRRRRGDPLLAARRRRTGRALGRSISMT